MSTLQTKKYIALDILDILQKKTDENYPMTQKEIQNILERDYGLKVDRKTVKRSLAELVDCDHPIGYREISRGNNPDAEPICTDWYYSHPFTEAELHLLIDSMLFAKYIPKKQCNDLVEKLEKLAGEHFPIKVKLDNLLLEHTASNKQFFFNVEILNEAIEKNRKVSFRYGKYHTDKQLHDKCDRNGEPITYTISPYRMAINAGRYYLIANTDGHDNVSHYRIDRIRNIKLLQNDVAKPMREVKGIENGLDLSAYMADHIHMQSGESEHVTFKIPKKHLDDVMDWFGRKELRFTDETDDCVTVSVRVNRGAIKYWALQYCYVVEILSPQSLRDEVAKLLSDAAEKYR